MMKPYKVILPHRLLVTPTKKKYFYINLNSYRNAHYFTLNKANKMFKEQIKEQVDVLPVFKSCQLMYTNYPGTDHLQDTANICSIADKFFSDALVEAGKLEDDNYNFVKGSLYYPGSIDKENPRIEVNIFCYVLK